MPPIQTEAVRSGTTAEWADTDASDGAAAPILSQGEVGIDRTTGAIKVGDGTTAFADLPELKRVKSGRATLVAGTVTVADTGITANSNVWAAHQTLGTVTAAKLITITRSAGVSVTFTSTDNTDTSVIAYWITD